MNALLQRLSNAWFAEAPSSRLALLRITTASYALWYLGERIGLLGQIAETEHRLYDPVSIINWLPAPLAPDLFVAIVWATLALNICYLLGLAHRWTGPLFAAALYFTLCYRNSWSMIYHSQNILVFHVLILGVTRAADSLSIDSWLRCRRHTQNNTDQVNPRYGWPIKLMCLSTLLVYLLTGIAKIATPAGFLWAKGDALRSQVAVDSIRKEALGETPGVLAPFLFEHIWIFTALGITTLIVELGAPFAILNRRLGQVWCVATFTMHWGIFFIMGIRFRYQMSGVLFMSFFNIERLLKIGKANRLCQRMRLASKRV